jgi:hypothetical protein
VRPQLRRRPAPRPSRLTSIRSSPPTGSRRSDTGLTLALQAERDENGCRRDFAPSEAVALGAKLEPLEAERAKERQTMAGPADGSGRKESGSGKFPEALKGQTRDRIADSLGMSGRTYEKAKRVVRAAEEDPGAFADLGDAGPHLATGVGVAPATPR